MTTLIKNGLVYDGTGATPVNQDILIRGNTIAKIGKLSRSAATEVIDAGSAMVTPGFIDVTSHSDHHMSVFYEPTQEDFIRQGITSIIGGNCGVSLAPQIGGSLEAVREWGSTRGINVGWNTMKEFLAIMEERPLGVNFGTLVGHTSLRRAITKNSFRDLTEKESDSLSHIIGEALKEGALGLSFGLQHTHALHTPHHELLAVAKTVGAHKGVLAAHLRNTEERSVDALREIVEIMNATNVNTHISHLQPLKKYRDEYREIADIIEQESAGHQIHFDVQPFDSYPALIYELLPDWLHEESLERMVENSLAKSAEDRLLPYLQKFSPNDCIVTHVADASLKYLEGRSLREYAERHGDSYGYGLLRFMRLTKLRATVAIRNVDTMVLEDYLAHPNSIISTNSASFAKKEFKYVTSTETFPEFLRFADSSKKLSLEKAVMKATSIPAKKFGIQKRGILKEGNSADLVILSNFEPTYVFVNGTMALKEGEPLHTRSGRILRK